jgi:hypothetical protein
MSIMLFMGWGLNYMQKIDMGIAIGMFIVSLYVKQQTDFFQ